MRTLYLSAFTGGCFVGWDATGGPVGWTGCAWPHRLPPADVHAPNHTCAGAPLPHVRCLQRRRLLGDPQGSSEFPEARAAPFALFSGCGGRGEACVEACVEATPGREGGQQQARGQRARGAGACCCCRQAGVHAPAGRTCPSARHQHSAGWPALSQRRNSPDPSTTIVGRPSAWWPASGSALLKRPSLYTHSGPCPPCHPCPPRSLQSTGIVSGAAKSERCPGPARGPCSGPTLTGPSSHAGSSLTESLHNSKHCQGDGWGRRWELAPGRQLRCPCRPAPRAGPQWQLRLSRSPLQLPYECMPGNAGPPTAALVERPPSCAQR